MQLNVKRVGEIVAIREFVHILESGQREKATIEIGKPYQVEEQMFVCPYRVCSESYEHILGMVGIDSYQALDLAMKTMEAELMRWQQNEGGTFEFLDEPGAGLSENA